MATPDVTVAIAGSNAEPLVERPTVDVAPSERASAATSRLSTPSRLSRQLSQQALSIARTLAGSAQQEVYCPICMCYAAEGDTIQLPACGHRLCRACAISWIDAGVQERRITFQCVHESDPVAADAAHAAGAAAATATAYGTGLAKLDAPAAGTASADAGGSSHACGAPLGHNDVLAILATAPEVRAKYERVATLVSDPPGCCAPGSCSAACGRTFWNQLMVVVNQVAFAVFYIFAVLIVLPLAIVASPFYAIYAQARRCCCRSAAKKQTTPAPAEETAAGAQRPGAAAGAASTAGKKPAVARAVKPAAATAPSAAPAAASSSNAALVAVMVAAP